MPRGSNEPKSVLTGHNTVPVQAEIPGTEQEKVPAIERAANKYDETRRTWQGLGEELQNHKAKLVETVRLHADKLQKDSDGTLAYVRGDYKITVGQKETLKVKIDGADPLADEE
jgi:hypothetical protein